MEWDSPWGVGFPGWHIECSAMSAKHLGPFFDIHTGGEDHIPVHHTNEIAQTEACHGTKLANFWMHGYFLQLNGAKMSKSSGEFLRMQLLIDSGYDPLAYRYFTLNGHYRTKLNFDWDTLDAAAKALDRLHRIVHGWGEAGSVDEDFMDRFMTHIDNDLNLPRALALAWDLTRSNLPDSTKKATIVEFDRILGLGLADWEPDEVVIPDEVMALVEQRQQARAEKRWADADALRDQITAAGYQIKDTPQGAEIEPLR
jgi:cysteinyl-tRNA synthetase